MNEFIYLLIGFFIGLIAGIAIITWTMSAKLEDLRKNRDYFKRRAGELTIKLNNAWKSWQLENERAQNISIANEELQTELYILEGCMETVLNADYQKAQSELKHSEVH